MKTRLISIGIVVLAVMICSLPAIAHTDSSAANLVMTAGTTAVDNGNLGGSYVGQNAIKNLARTSDPEVGWTGLFHSSNRGSLDNMVTLTITFPTAVKFNTIAWNTPNTGDGGWTDAGTQQHWTAIVNGDAVVDKDDETASFPGIPYGWKNMPVGLSDERASFAAVTSNKIILIFNPIARAGGFYYGVRDINVYNAVPEPSALLALATGFVGLLGAALRRKKS